MRRRSGNTPPLCPARLADEHCAEDVSYSTVSDYVAERRLEILAEAAGKAAATATFRGPDVVRCTVNYRPCDTAHSAAKKGRG